MGILIFATIAFLVWFIYSLRKEARELPSA